MDYPLKGALIRFFRVVGGAALGAAVGAAINAQPVLEVDLSGTDYGVFVVVFGALVTGLDKYARERGWYGSAE